MHTRSVSHLNKLINYFSSARREAIEIHVDKPKDDMRVSGRTQAED